MEASSSINQSAMKSTRKKQGIKVARVEAVGESDSFISLDMRDETDIFPLPPDDSESNLSEEYQERFTGLPAGRKRCVLGVKE